MLEGNKQLYIDICINNKIIYNAYNLYNNRIF